MQPEIEKNPTKPAHDIGTVTEKEGMALRHIMAAFVQIFLAELSQGSLLQDTWVSLAEWRSVALQLSKTAHAAVESTTAAEH